MQIADHVSSYILLVSLITTVGQVQKYLRTMPLHQTVQPSKPG
jgi:hypothetical protein